MVHIKISKKIKYTLSAAIIFSIILLVAVFINMRKTISESKKETAVFKMVKNVDAVYLNTAYAERIREIYLKNNNEVYLKKYRDVSNTIKVNKNELLDYSIKNNYKKDSILLLANVATRKIANSNTIIDIKKYGGNNKKDIFLYDSIGKTQIDSIIVLSTALNKNGINILKETALARQEATNNQLVLFILLALLFFTNLALAYLYFKNDFKKKKQVNKVLLYNSTLLQNIYDAIITIDNNYIITDWNVHAENLYGYSARRQKENQFYAYLQKMSMIQKS
jgi:CHASE3 domain sensor protein